MREKEYRGFGGLGLTIWIGVGIILGLSLLVLGLVRLWSRRAGFGGGRVRVSRRMKSGGDLMSALADPGRRTANAKFVESPIQAAVPYARHREIEPAGAAGPGDAERRCESLLRLPRRGHQRRVWPLHF